jgi:phosphate transport system substrate-binding protein
MRNLIVFMAALAASAIGCKGSSSGGGSGAEPTDAATTNTTAAAASKDDVVSLNGAGATFPYPLYSKWVSEYGSANPKIRINYQSVGSGAGIKQITDKTVDFGASDAPMSDEQLAKASGKLIHIPTTLGAVVITYNVPAVTQPLKLTGELLANIFLGDIKNWNDPKIAGINPGAKLPAQAIAIVHRSDGSGTTAVFTDYLSKTNAAWKTKVGTSTSVNWPAGTGAKGNEGVTGSVKTTPGSIGYCELAYAKQNGLPTAELKNQAGKFVAPSLESVSAAAAALSDKVPEDLRVSITDAPGDVSYPISSFTYLLVYENSDNAVKAGALAKFIWWAVHDGQKLEAPLHYAELPKEMLTKVEGKLKSLKSGDKALLAGN